MTTEIAIQNFPERMAVSIPFVNEGYSKFKSFWYGQIYTSVEPLAGFLGTLVFVVIKDFIPELQISENTEFVSVNAIIGFTLMIFLDTVFE